MSLIFDALQQPATTPANPAATPARTPPSASSSHDTAKVLLGALTIALGSGALLWFLFSDAPPMSLPPAMAADIRTSATASNANPQSLPAPLSATPQHVMQQAMQQQIEQQQEHIAQLQRQLQTPALAAPLANLLPELDKTTSAPIPAYAATLEPGPNARPATLPEGTFSVQSNAQQHADSAAQQREHNIASTIAAFDQSSAQANFVDAQQHLNKLEKLLPKDSLTLLRRRAWLALQQGEQQAAESAYTTILLRLPKDENAHINLAILEAGQGKTQAALERLQRVLQSNPDSVDAQTIVQRLQISALR